MIIDKDWWIATWDDVVRESADNGADVGAARAEVARRFEAAVKAGDLPAPDVSLIELGLMRFDEVIAPERQRRKSGLRKDIEYLADSLFTDEHANVDPVLDLAIPIGDGRDKTLRFWSLEDWQDATKTRYRNAAKVTAAAAAFDEIAQRITDALKARGVNHTGDLFA